MKPLLDLLTTRLPGVLRIRDGAAFATGNNLTLPDCTAPRIGEWRWIKGGAGVSDRSVVCFKDETDTYAWRNMGRGSAWNVLTDGDPVAPAIIFADDDVVMLETLR